MLVGSATGEAREARRDGNFRECDTSQSYRDNGGWGGGRGTDTWPIRGAPFGTSCYLSASALILLSSSASCFFSNRLRPLGVGTRSRTNPPHFTVSCVSGGQPNGLAHSRALAFTEPYQRCTYEGHAIAIDSWVIEHVPSTFSSDPRAGLNTSRAGD